MVRVGVSVGVDGSVAIGFLVGVRVAVGVGANVEVAVSNCVEVDLVGGMFVFAGAKVATLTELTSLASESTTVGCYLLQPAANTMQPSSINRTNILLEKAISSLQY